MRHFRKKMMERRPRSIFQPVGDVVVGSPTLLFLLLLLLALLALLVLLLLSFSSRSPSSYFPYFFFRMRFFTSYMDLGDGIHTGPQRFDLERRGVTHDDIVFRCRSLPDTGRTEHSQTRVIPFASYPLCLFVQTRVCPSGEYAHKLLSCLKTLEKFIFREREKITVVVVVRR